ncbi:Spx/MgsR family RNA polymerase-binding regulatory protein [Sphingobacterium bovistauri]|uniref:Spx/MgsR family RNA polymerase-binding regulatory protein n=1 Tax=Sphingobacterium bovistauri TaxID=2781959 RepID=A0ABS7Z2A9_9SPHI|nr:Spx/MgsR family RNA polymerase-binding regulatory protein [Sphingobacterium bovistauri]MCA5003581.1 Spx/MgsR family RNA polymerase-binding regulatory protein [Sphingobacterium bovistauri]
MLHVYGIKNCNTVKKALDWLNANNIEFTFHDYKKEPAQESKLHEWQKLISWESLVNKKGTTWKKLTTEQQAAVIDETSARVVLLANNSMIKRPLIELKNDLILGFDEQIYQQKLL